MKIINQFDFIHFQWLILQSSEHVYWDVKLILMIPSGCSVGGLLGSLGNLSSFTNNIHPYGIVIYLLCSILIVSLILITSLATFIDLGIVKCGYLNISILRLFSIKNSFNVMFEKRKKQNSNMNSLYAIRVLILLWIIIVHTFIVVDFQYFRM